MADWSEKEVEAIVSDYLHMLVQELAGQSYNKSAHRRALLPRLSGRSEQSVEMKHRNISAVMVELGAPWIVGYKPLPNYQGLLYEAVVQRLDLDSDFERAAIHAVEAPATNPLAIEYSGFLTDAPAFEEIGETPTTPYQRRTKGVKRDYLAMEARNRSLGAAGEAYVLAFERYRLFSVGAKHLVDRVEQVSVTKGDGLGYDVMSFDADGKERLIEVKTTAFGREAPFYVTKQELAVSKAESGCFRLYRLFEFRLHPRMFELPGAISDRCRLDPISYLATFR